MLGYMEKGIQTPMAQGLSTKIISMIKWIRTIRLSIKTSLSLSLACRRVQSGRAFARFNRVAFARFNRVAFSRAIRATGQFL